MTLSELRRSPVEQQVSQESVSRANEPLQDFSLQTRAGLRGPNAVSVFTDLGIEIPEAPNQIITIDANFAVMRLSSTECWLLSTASDLLLNNLSGPTPKIASLIKPDVFQTLPDVMAGKKSCYPLMCQFSHAWFVLDHPDRAKVLAQLCGVDLRPIAFPVGSVAQTSVAKVSTIIASHKINEKDVFFVFCDSSVAEYLWREIRNCLAKFHS